MLLLAVALMPLGSARVSANDEITKADATRIETGNLDPAVAVVDAGTAQAPIDVTPEPVLAPPVAYATLTVNKQGCPQRYGGDHGQLTANCSPMDAAFQVSDASTTAAFTGSFTDDQVTPGDVSIAEGIPDGYGAPAVFCDVFDGQGGESGFSAYPVSADGILAGVQMASGSILSCDWFNVLSDGGAGVIHVDKHGCPEQFDAYNAGHDDLAANCTASMDGVVFDLSGSGGAAAATATTGAAIPGAVEFGSLDAGTYGVSEQIPAGYGKPVVFCRSDALTFAAAPLQLDIIDGHSVQTDLADGQRLVCDWYNVPDGGGSITIHKYTCPSGYVPDLAVGTPESDCANPTDGVTFTLKHAGSPDLVTATGDSVPGAAVWADLPMGDFNAVETYPAGTVSAFVLDCTSDRRQTVAKSSPVTIGADGAYAITLSDNEHVECFWYNVPGDGGTITVHKWSCPADAAFGAMGWTDYQTACADSMNGIDFTLVKDGSLVSVKTTGGDGDGLALWKNLSAGTVTLTEAIPTGYGDPVVFCGFSAIIVRNGAPIAVDGQIPPSATVGGVLTHDFLANEQLYCDWFNVPSRETTITIYKYTCPAGYDLAAPGADAQAHGLTLTDGVAFTLRHGADVPRQTTTGDVEPGAVHWGGLSGGGYSVQEQAPAATAQTFVTCQWIEVTGAYKYLSITPYPSIPSAVGDTIDLSLTRGERIVCQWYNSPRKPRDGGTLTVVKYWCDGAVHSVAACSLYGGGADFSLSATGGGAPILFTTGADGTYGLSLPAGAWTLKEIGREWCRAQSSDVDGAGNLVTSDGHDSVVTIYNRGPGKKKEPPVRQFPNTGSGPAASSLVTGGGGHQL
ncbi:MAG: hypothetical protein ACR2OO_13155, partial [Thermomicrobiales bacterium]